jgi:hypothetical protein
MSILNVIERVRREPPIVHPGGTLPDFRYVYKVLEPVPWNRGEVERALGFEIPPDLAELWNRCGGLILHKEETFHQSGLLVCAPTDPDFFKLNREYHEDNADNKLFSGRLLPGDLILGRFWGDLELPLLRCDKTASDYGTVMIVPEMEPLRKDWYIAAPSLEEFLVRFMDAHGAKYWEYYYRTRMSLQKNVIERARREPRCKVLDPVQWDREEVERTLGLWIPTDLAQLWKLCRGLILYEDTTSQEGGLVVCAPPDPEFFTMNREYREDKGDSVRPGDLIFARFRGSRERVLIRCDRYAVPDDCLTIMIVPETGPRSEWPTAAPSLEEFLVRFMDAHGEKYWEYHYKKWLAERAAKER